MKSSPILSALIGILCGVGCLVFVLAALKGVRPSVYAHAVALGICVLWAALPVMVNRAWRANIVAISGYVCFGALMAMGVFASVSLVGTIRWRAEQDAAGKPYCLQVPKPTGGYAPVTSLLDLSPLTMRARHGDGLDLTHHAVLVIGEELSAYWSYRQRTFMVKPMPEPVYCDAKPHFTESLPLFSSHSDDPVRIGLDGKVFHIPRAYAPRADMSAFATLFIDAVPPDFLPSGRKDKYVLAEKNAKWVAGLLTDAQPDDEATNFNLRKTRSGWYYLNEGGEVTVINCYPGRCQHRFTRNGWMYDFEHHPDLLPQWRQLQQSLLNRLASFTE